MNENESNKLKSASERWSALEMKSGTEVHFWPDRKPFIVLAPLKAIVLGVHGEDAETVRLSVFNSDTGRRFLTSAKLADRPAPGAFTLPEA